MATPETPSVKNPVDTFYGFQSSYCCGGEIRVTKDPIVKPDSGTTKDGPIWAPPTTIRFDVPNQSPRALTLKLPLQLPTQPAPGGLQTLQAEDNSGATPQPFAELLKACTPATFGLGGEDVLDEQYRKAGKLDREQFSTLLPEALDEVMKSRNDHRGVLAELYKLNIYSGPGGKFKAHVDTPRGVTQFGSLVVCLPHSFKGGKFRVSHGSSSTFFDWATDEPNTIQWAAFYSDCEHEVLEVLKGHRITLTYNLYATERVGGPLQVHPTVDAKLSPFAAAARAVLADSTFLPQAADLMPYALKGVDCVIFSVFKSLDLKTRARPVMGEHEHYAYCAYYPSDDTPDHSGPITVVGEKFHARAEGNDNEIEQSWGMIRQELKRAFPNSARRNVFWINKPKHEELAIAKLHYGNQATVDLIYSRAAILVDIPKWGEKGRGVVA
ncbi:hypothetical protein GLAREA_12139 [Glarea lozoyensis ATCC 20868]|uniref:Fe2OG dioxygenase domain-containing protein n=1 Tax=Glarea lozoyensis (strain ATCC 20868 / MF5171) TaxID=1116229 RepID=S3D0J5_GLAL2|nr:uncharacterized protein GLAREA_12139 [Glarea lozoyensis ATCC 20868]EPE32057.1 hypothetical protein GLAREA_12139 [Glarea lozoyensis ATCC 20868]